MARVEPQAGQGILVRALKRQPQKDKKAGFDSEVKFKKSQICPTTKAMPKIR